MITEKIRIGRSAIGGASGAVAGLVAITPSRAFVHLTGSRITGCPRRRPSLPGLQPQFRFTRDDALDVLGVHLAGGASGWSA